MEEEEVEEEVERVVNLDLKQGCKSQMKGGDSTMADKKAKKAKPNMKGKGKVPVKTAPVKNSK